MVIFIFYVMSKFIAKGTAYQQVNKSLNSIVPLLCATIS